MLNQLFWIGTDLFGNRLVICLVFLQRDDEGIGRQ